MRVKEIVEGKEYRLLTDIGGVGYTRAMVLSSGN